MNFLDPQTQVYHSVPEDWARQRALRLRALEEAPDAFSANLEVERAYEEAIWRGRAQRALATLIAVSGSHDVGLAVVAGASAEDHLEAVGLYSVWVAPEARGSGVGQALVMAAIEVAQRAGAKRLVLHVGDHNHPAIALYARMGFAPTGQVAPLPPPREHILEHERVLLL